jgi:hypothetical protein
MDIKEAGGRLAAAKAEYEAVLKRTHEERQTAKRTFYKALEEYNRALKGK